MRIQEDKGEEEKSKNAKKSRKQPKRRGEERCGAAGKKIDFDALKLILLNKFFRCSKAVDSASLKEEEEKNICIYIYKAVKANGRHKTLLRLFCWRIGWFSKNILALLLGYDSF